LLNADVVTPAFAASLGMQIDVNKVPQPIVDALLGDDFAFKQAALNSHDLTISLLQADAVLGLKAQFNDPAQPNRVRMLVLPVLYVMVRLIQYHSKSHRHQRLLHHYLLVSQLLDHLMRILHWVLFLPILLLLLVEL
jgi:hypothetical protein